MSHTGIQAVFHCIFLYARNFTLQFDGIFSASCFLSDLKVFIYVTIICLLHLRGTCTSFFPEAVKLPAYFPRCLEVPTVKKKETKKQKKPINNLKRELSIYHVEPVCATVMCLCLCIYSKQLTGLRTAT